MINSVGKNAKRMLEIGVVQDKLEELNFKRLKSFYQLENGETILLDEFISQRDHTYNDDENLIVDKVRILFDASSCSVFVGSIQIETYSHSEVLTKVKELMNYN
jgi:hypothetical protein